MIYKQQYNDQMSASVSVDGGRVLLTALHVHDDGAYSLATVEIDHVQADALAMALHVASMQAERGS